MLAGSMLRERGTNMLAKHSWLLLAAALAMAACGNADVTALELPDGFSLRVVTNTVKNARQMALDDSDLKIRQVAHDHLFLQRDRCAADDHGLAQCLGNRNGGQAIRRRLTGTGTRLDRGEPG